MILGVQFDSETMDWSVSKEKEQSMQQLIDFFIKNKTCNLKVQKLHEKLANFALSMELMLQIQFAPVAKQVPRPGRGKNYS